MKSLVERDKKRRLLYKQFEPKRRLLKSIIYNQDVSDEQRIEAQSALCRLPRNSSKTRIKNRCVITGRSKSVYKYFKISRIQLRNLALNGKIGGYSKVSW
jgi:small subunit ribosomal protein S14